MNLNITSMLNKDVWTYLLVPGRTTQAIVPLSLTERVKGSPFLKQKEAANGGQCWQVHGWC